MDIRKQIIKARKQKKITVQTLAKWCNVSPALLYAYESNRTNISEVNINKIIDELGMRIILIDKEV